MSSTAGKSGDAPLTRIPNPEHISLQSPEAHPKGRLSLLIPRLEPKPGHARTILDAAGTDARVILSADPQIRRLCDEYRRVRTFSNEDETPDGFDALTDIMHRIDELAERIVIDALRRQGLKFINVFVICVPGAGAPHVTIKLKHRGREVRLHMEIPI